MKKEVTRMEGVEGCKLKNLLDGCKVNKWIVEYLEPVQGWICLGGLSVRLHT